MIENESIMEFLWEYMRRHPTNDIAIVQIDKIFLYVISDRSRNTDKFHEMLT
jgi:hypothetical protein